MGQRSPEKSVSRSCVAHARRGSTHVQYWYWRPFSLCPWCGWITTKGWGSGCLGVLQCLTSAPQHKAFPQNSCPHAWDFDPYTYGSACHQNGPYTNTVTTHTLRCITLRHVPGCSTTAMAAFMQAAPSVPKWPLAPALEAIAEVPSHRNSRERPAM